MRGSDGAASLDVETAVRLRDAAEAAGRPRDAVQVGSALPVAVSDDVDGLRAFAAQRYAMYGQLPSYRAMLDREGYAGPEDAALIGSESEVTERLAEVRAAGVDEFVADTFDPAPEGRARTRALLDFLLEIFGGQDADPWLAPARTAA